MVEEVPQLQICKSVYTLNVVDGPLPATSGKYRFELPAQVGELAAIAVVQGLYDGIASWNTPQQRSKQAIRQGLAETLEGYAELDEETGLQGTNDLGLCRNIFTAAYLPARRSVYRLLADDWQLAVQLSQLKRDILLRELAYYVDEHHLELTHTLDQYQVIELPLPFLIGDDR